MSPLEARAHETWEWMEKALEDLECARVLRQTGHGGNALFHCQQSAEKSLKSFLVWHERPFRKTRDLKEVGQVCLLIDPSLADSLRHAYLLTEYAWKIAIPRGTLHPSRRRAK